MKTGIAASAQGRLAIGWIAAFVAATGIMQAAPLIPVTNCGQDLNIDGGSYALTGNLTCPGTALMISAKDVKLALNGFVIAGDNTGAGIEVGAVSGVRIRGGTIARFVVGIHISGATDARVSSMVLMGNGDGISLQSSKGNRIAGNLISSNTIGVRLENSNDNTVSTNTISNNRNDPSFAVSAGVLVQNGSSSNLISGNLIGSNGDVGVTIQASDGNIIKGNTVSDTMDFNGNPTPGITVVGSSSTIVSGNTATGNSFGIELAPGLGGAAANLVESNTTNSNGQGILVLAGATANTLQLNTAAGNSVVDLNDGNACNLNTWASNTFATDQVAGLSDGGPGVGCIQ